jgi:hypothetical protein
VADEYASGEYRYWHLSVPSPELTQAIASGEHGSGRFVQADVGRLPFAAGSFDSALDRG